MRSFSDTKAVRSHVPVLVALFGPSGGGKTFSALRLATGIQRVVGGDIFVIDTESKRSTHYADQFNFRHVDFRAPFGPLDYLAAIEYCVKQGAKTIIIDSLSHEHEGPGGVLEMHDKVVEAKGQNHNMLAWAKPKGERRRLINTVLQLDVNLICCFRAKEKLDVNVKPPKNLGWMAIGGEEFLYEMTMGALLPPLCSGTPDWNPRRDGERQMVKMPRQFDKVLPGKQLSEDIGEAMARWAAGGDAVKPDGPFTFPKGEHKGKTVGDVPVAYLERLQASGVGGPLGKLIAAELERRPPESQPADSNGEMTPDEERDAFGEGTP